jgi:NADPH:quinone reductase
MPKAVRIHVTGGPEVLRLEEVSLPAPAAGQIRIRHTAIGVNYIDTYHRSGLYPKPLPAGLGVEAAGVVAAVGPGVTTVREGDRVAYVGGAADAYSEETIVPAAGVIPLPGGIADETAAAIMLKGLTVHMLFHRVAKPARGETVLFHAAAGGVGMLASQWAREIGVRMIGTVGSREKAELARSRGCAETILYREEDLVARTRELTGGRGVPVVYDSVGRDTLVKSIECLTPRGLLVSFGNASGPPPPLELAALAKGSLFATRPTLFHYIADPAEREEACAMLFRMVESGAISVEIGHRYPLADAVKAHQDLEARRTTGSIVLIP